MTAAAPLSRKLWLCLPPFVLALLDYTLTLTGQPPAYWTGAYEHAEELNPIARVFLVWHPWAFIALGAAWVLVFSVGLVWLPPAMARVASFLLTFSHAVGSCSWLWRLGPVGILLTVVVFLAAERLLDWAWKRSSR
jgi:hypothetical protein